MFRRWSRDGWSAPLSPRRGARALGSLWRADPRPWPPRGGCEPWRSGVRTQRTRTGSPADAVLSWAPPIEPSAPFSYYVPMLQNASSLDRKDTWRSQFLLCGFSDDYS